MKYNPINRQMFEKNVEIKEKVNEGMLKEVVMEVFQITEEYYEKVASDFTYEKMQQQLKSQFHRFDEYIEMYRNGYMLSEIAEKYNVSRQSVFSTLKRLKIDMEQGGIHKRKKSYIANLEKCANQELTLKEAARKLDLSVEYVKILADKHQIEIKSEKKYQKEKLESEIMDLRKIGYTQEKIALELNISQTNVSKVLVKNNQRSKLSKKVCEKRDKKIVKMYLLQEKKDLGRIAETFGITKRNVGRILNDYKQKQKKISCEEKRELVFH